MLIDSMKNSIAPLSKPAPQAEGGFRASGATATSEAVSLIGVAASGVREVNGSAPGAEPQVGTPEEIQQAVDDVKELIQTVRRDLNLNIDEDSGRLVIKVIDRDSEEVVRQIPSEEILSFIQKLSKLIESREGVLIQEKA
ncbi:MAG: flagellar protein FlaG [Pseudomonadota bacterium]